MSLVSSAPSHAHPAAKVFDVLKNYIGLRRLRLRRMRFVREQFYLAATV